MVRSSHPAQEAVAMMRRWVLVRLALLAAPFVIGVLALWAQETPAPPQPLPASPQEAPAQDGGQKGVEVLTRGPIHEAFASLVTEPQATPLMEKKPPATIEEMPPAEKPEGNVIWIKGYWAWDDDRHDYLWVSGVWRTPPPGKEWIPGYWREEGDKAQWVPGFWTAAAAREGAKQDVTYLPEPPKTPQVQPPPQPPDQPDTFYVPGHHEWIGDHYVWVAGYWAKVQPDYVWIPGHYRWTPSGYLYIPGYWDLAVSRRGVMYAPVVIDPRVITVSYVYTPCYAVHDTVVVDTLWVRPAHCHYYFGDYYGEEYHDRGYVSCVVYSRDHYDSIIVYERYEHRRDPDWFEVRVRTYDERERFPERRPPRTLVQQNIVVKQNVTNVTNNYYMVAPPAQVAAAKGQKVVPVEPKQRMEALEQAKVVQNAAVQRTQTEVKVPPGTPIKPRVASLSVPATQPVAAKPAPPQTTVQQQHPATTPNTTAQQHPTAPNTTAAKPPASSGVVQTGATTTPGAKVPATTGTTGDPGKPGTTTQPPATTPTTPPVKPPATTPVKPPPPPPGKQPPKDKDKDKDKDKPRQ
jgi:hypothetical protein